ncbi:hypothetical protein D9M71_526740 [compost metagenome]
MKLTEEQKQDLKNRAIALIRKGTGRFNAHPYSVNVTHATVDVHLNGLLLASICPKGKASEFNAGYDVIEKAMISARKHA